MVEGAILYVDSSAWTSSQIVGRSPTTGVFTLHEKNYMVDIGKRVRKDHSGRE